VGSGVDLARVARHFEQLGKEGAEDAQFYRDKLDRFLADWKVWRMDECFAQPEEFFRQSVAAMAAERLLGLNAVRANPRMAGYSLTGTVDQGMSGEGLTTTFRELKPGTVDAMFDGFAPLRWCLFAEPVNVYCGAPVRLEAVLANEDVLTPGEYPVRLLVVGPDGKPVVDRRQSVTIADPRKKPEPALAQRVFDEEIPIDGPSGKYRFLVTFERGGAAAGGETVFYVSDPKDMPAVETEVTLWGDDAPLADWLTKQGIRTKPFSSDAPAGREVILVGRKAPAEPKKAFPALAQRIARGSVAVFLAPEVFRQGDKLAWVPLKNKGAVHSIGGSLYHKDEWAKRHPIFEGLPCGGLMDWVFYRDIIPDPVWVGLDPPAEAVAGANNVSFNYAAGLTVSVHSLGAGRFVLNTLQITNRLGVHPAAERLLRNMLRYAARDRDKPLAPLPADFEQQLQAMGY
jgi:hypothetical protein